MSKDEVYRLSEVIQDFLNAKKAERLSHYTIRSYESITRIFKSYFEGDPVFCEITSREIRAFLASLDHLKNKSLYNYHVCLSSLWTYAISENIVLVNEVQKIKKPKYLKKRIIPFTDKELKKIIRACRSKRDEAIIFILLDSGLRAAELLNLTVQDWEPGLLIVRKGKGNKARVAPISKKTEKKIFQNLSSRRIDLGGISGGDALFASNISGKRLNYNSLRSILRGIEKIAGFHIHSHRFRHTFAIKFLKNGGDIFSLQKILGHTTLEMVRHYLDIANEDLFRSHEKASPIINLLKQ